MVASDAPPDAPPPTRSRSSRLLERCKAEERRLLFGGEGEYGYYEGEEYADAEEQYEEGDPSSRDLYQVTSREESEEGGVLDPTGRALRELYMHADEVDASTEGEVSD